MNEQMQKMKELVQFFKAFGDQTWMRLIRVIASGMVDKINVNDGSISNYSNALRVKLGKDGKG